MRRLRELAAELYRRDPLLAAMGWMLVAVLLGCALYAPFDPRTILGLDPWVKPAKFLVSIAIFVWTVGWLLHELPGPKRGKAVVRVGLALAMTVEMSCLLMQSVRGTRSHYNFETPFDDAVFVVMGVFIALSTVLIGYLLLLFLVQRPPLAAPYLWGIRLGLVVFLLASAEGVALIAHGAHAVGVPDGGPGLPFVNWSTEAGDLRVAHFVGLHGLQAIPLFGWWASRWNALAPAHATLAVVAFAGIYAAVAVAAYVQAVGGMPLLAR